MTSQTERIETVSVAIADFIVDDLDREELTKEQLLSPTEPTDLPAILDSADLLELAGFIEDTYDVIVDDDEIVAETFATVRQVAKFVVQKQTEVVS